MEASGAAGVVAGAARLWVETAQVLLAEARVAGAHRMDVGGGGQRRPGPVVGAGEAVGRVGRPCSEIGQRAPAAGGQRLSRF